MKNKSVKLPFDTNKISNTILLNFLQEKQISNLSSVLIYNWPSVLSLVLTEKTTSNEYLSIESKKSFNEKTVLRTS